jgi:Helix-turn-helix domain
VGGTFVITLRFDEDELARLASRIVEQLSSSSGICSDRWLDVAGAGAHLGLSEHAIRGLVKRQQLPVHRTENGRLRFSPTELDEWVRSGLAKSDTRTYHDRP